MKGLGMSAKTTTIVFLIGVIFASLALSGYTFLVSNHPAGLPSLKEGLDDGSDEKKKDAEGESEKKADGSSTPGPSSPGVPPYSPAN
jgi:hypothetical protein